MFSLFHLERNIAREASLSMVSPPLLIGSTLQQERITSRALRNRRKKKMLRNFMFFTLFIDHRLSWYYATTMLLPSKIGSHLAMSKQDMYFQ